MRKFESLAEIELLPGYLSKVKRGEFQFLRIYGWYQFKDRLRCSLADCGTPHNRGYVVMLIPQATTKIGNVCGKRIFGEAFTAASNEFERGLAIKRTLDAISATLAGAPQLEVKIAELMDRARGARWLRRAQISLARVCSNDVYQRLMDRVLRRNAEIVKIRHRTDGDPPALDGSHSGFLTEVIAVFHGLKGLAPPEPIQVLNEHVLRPIREFLEFSPEEIFRNSSKYKYYRTWERDLAGHLDAVEQKLRQAEIFFTTPNLRNLQYLATRNDDRITLSRLQWNEQTGLVKGS